MDKKTALQKTIDMWSWIYKETVEQKRKVGKYEYPQLMGKSIQYSCFLCEYTTQFTYRGIDVCCTECPMEFGTKNRIVNFQCENRADSPFRNWLRSTNWEDAAKYAKEIYKQAGVALKELKGKSNG